ncbi:hypothetical protein J437_LFUL010243 [Ladona fulva]|uniref:BMERB domain-containing protein n=1 Tax=Ladona fulva TaxID=123851 RepID=A0A8K0KAT7_LADFU|nr:hypothetical protein J437_LFUL010243 [Ladona fulva]
MPVFIAERLRIPHLPRTERGEEDSGGGNSSPPSQQSFLLMHRTCFRCARCRTQLSPAGGYYETESGAFCCEVCPDEEPASPVHRPARNSHGDPEGTLAVQTDEESEPEDHSDAAVGSNMDSYSEDFESALEASGGVGDSSPVHTAIPDGASSSLDGIQLPCNVQASDGAISLNAKSSSSNSSYLSFKSHPESSPIIKRINEVISEERAEADGQKKPSENKSESKEPESQHYKSDVSQFVQRLRPTNVIEKGDDGGVKALGKEEVGSSKEEVSGQSNRPFSVVDRVRMFEREVKVRQSLPKDNKPVVVKEMDQNVRETESVPAKKEAAIDAVGSLSVSETSVTTSIGSKYIPKEESKGAPEVKESILRKSIEDIPFMDENGGTSLNEEITEIPVKDTINLKDEESQLDIPIEEKMEVVNKETNSEFPHQEQPPQCKEEVISLPREEAATGSGGNANASLLESIDAAKSEGSMQLKSVVSSLEVKTEKIGDVDQEKPSEESVKLEEDEKEEVIAEDKKEEAVVEEFAVEDKVVLKSKLKEEPSDSITVVIDSPKEEASASKLEGKKIKVYPKPSDKINYPVDLNPFGDEDEEEESKTAQVVKKKIIPVSLNPFGSSDEEEEEEVVLRKKIPVPAIRKSLNALDTVGRSKRHSSEERTNPFWSAGEEDDDDGFPREKTRRKSQSNVSDADRPVPKPRTVWNSATSTPEPSPKPRRDASPCKSAESTLTRRRKKKPAPPPPLPTTPQPVPRSSTPTPLPSADVSIASSPSVSTTTSPGGTPRRPRKSRPAPPRPGDSPAQPRPSSPPRPESPSSSRDIVPLLPVSPSEDEDAVETTSTKEESDVNVPPPSPSHSKRPPPESEKRQKDAENRNRRSRTSVGEEEETQKEEVVQVVNERPPDKSTFGQWKRKKGPAPPRPLPPKRKINPHVPMSEIRRELCDIEVQQMELERQGVALERAIRARFQQEDSPNDAWIPAEVEAQVLQLFELVNEKNELFRRQAELMYMRRQLRLEEEHADLEFQIRCLMERPASLKTDADKEREEMLIQRLVEVVEARDEVVQCLESDRLREAQEDVTVRARLAGAFPGQLLVV